MSKKITKEDKLISITKLNTNRYQMLKEDNYWNTSINDKELTIEALQDGACKQKQPHQHKMKQDQYDVDMLSIEVLEKLLGEMHENYSSLVEMDNEMQECKVKIM